MLGVTCFVLVTSPAGALPQEAEGERAAAQLEKTLAPNRKDEPRAELSMRRGFDFAANASAAWRRRHSCVTCHTNGLFLLTGAELAPDSAAHRDNAKFARAYLRRFVASGEKPRGQRGSVEGIVATSAFLAIAESASGGVLSEVTRKSLDWVLERQAEDGHWPDWLKCRWPPYEVDDHFGVTLVALALGSVPRAYARTEKARRGMKRIRAWLAKNPARNPHQKAMTLWAATRTQGLLARAVREDWRKELLELQRPDGGWVLAELGASRWRRQDGSPQDTTSDAYATAFVVYVLRRLGVPAADPRIRRGVAWLERNQRKSGRWFVRSPKRDTKHFITHAATNFALLALASCGRKP